MIQDAKYKKERKKERDTAKKEIKIVNKRKT